MRQAEAGARLTMRRGAIDVTVGKPAGDAQRGAVEPRQIIARAEFEFAPDMPRKQRHRRARDRAMQETRHARRGAARLDNIEKFEDDRMRFEARFEFVHHCHEGIDSRWRMPRPELAPDRVAVGHEAVLVGIADPMNETVIGHQEAIRSGCGDPVEQYRVERAIFRPAGRLALHLAMHPVHLPDDGFRAARGAIAGEHRDEPGAARAADRVGLVGRMVPHP